MNEISIMKQLTHDNIMRLHEVHESQNSIYLILELLEGGELLDYISKKKGKIKVSEYKIIMKSILKALRYMSSKNIMHRDLKPENMILKNKSNSKENMLKIVDFGLATEANVEEYLFKRCGTPGFVAPEVVNAPSEENIHYSPKCDVFSAGVIFYLILSGRPPFAGKTFKTILQNNKECKISFEIEELQNCPPEVVGLLKKMLEPVVKKRYTAAECLAHPFFGPESLQELEQPGEQGGNSMEEFITPNAELSKLKDKYVMVTKNLIKTSKNPGISLEFRAPDINGHVDSYQDSTEFNSKNQIDSFNHMNSPTLKPKKDSIYKATLQKTGGSNKMVIKPVMSEYDSFYSTGSNGSSREEMDAEPAKHKPEADRKAVSQENSQDSDDEGDNDKHKHKKSRFGRDI